MVRFTASLRGLEQVHRHDCRHTTKNKKHEHKPKSRLPPECIDKPLPPIPLDLHRETGFVQHRPLKSPTSPGRPPPMGQYQHICHQSDKLTAETDVVMIYPPPRDPARPPLATVSTPPPASGHSVVRGSRSHFDLRRQQTPSFGSSSSKESSFGPATPRRSVDHSPAPGFLESCRRGSHDGVTGRFSPRSPKLAAPAPALLDPAVLENQAFTNPRECPQAVKSAWEESDSEEEGGGGNGEGEGRRGLKGILGLPLSPLRRRVGDK